MVAMSPYEVLVPLMLTGTPNNECSRAVSLMLVSESTPGPQLATDGIAKASSNMISVTQFVDR